MPSMPMSSRRPTKGEMKLAPALAASSAWLAEKQSVTLTMRLQFRADGLAGLQAVERQRHLDADIVGDLGQDLRFLHHLPVFGRHDLGGNRPSTMSQISLVTSAMLPPDFRISEGLVVTPSTQAEIVEFADFLDVGRVDKEFHEASPC
jgi:hypothetical protein